MNNIKADKIENYIVKKYGVIKHDKYAMADAINEVSYDMDTVDPWDIFLLVIENKPIKIVKKETWLVWFKRQTWLSALFAIGILLLPVIYLFSWINNDKQKIMQQYFVPYNIANIERNFDSAETTSYWIAAKTKYEKGNYEAAIKLFRKVMLTQSEDNHIDAFFIGLCQLGRKYKLPHQAREYFEQENLKNTDLFMPAQWYLALANIQCGEKDEAKAKLLFLSQQQKSYKQEEAKQLMEML